MRNRCRVVASGATFYSKGEKSEETSGSMSNLRPRKCVMEKGSGGYGFHLHGEKGKTGQFIRLVEPDTPASAAGLRAGDRLVFVNGESVEGEGHQQVVSRIRAAAGALELIVVDAETAELLKKHNLQCRKEFVEEGIPGTGASQRGDAQSNGAPRGATPVTRENGDASSDSSKRSSVSSSTKVESTKKQLQCPQPDNEAAVVEVKSSNCKTDLNGTTCSKNPEVYIFFPQCSLLRKEKCWGTFWI